jgi:hypothetical protein
LNKYLGRRGEIFLTAVCLTATPIGSGFAKTWEGLFAARFIMGIGIGAKNATVPIYSAEMAPARIRGALVMFWQLWVVIGIFLGFCANVIVKDTGRISWRLQLGSAFIPSFILMCGIFFCPESPRWLMKHGKVAQGFKSMNALRSHPIIGARDYYYSYVIYQEELKLAQGTNYFTRLRDCFTVPRIRRANYGASTVMIAQQMCGINIISFYSSTIFTKVGYTPTQALYASLGYGAVQVVFTIPTLFLIDTHPVPHHVPHHVRHAACCRSLTAQRRPHQEPGIAHRARCAVCVSVHDSVFHGRGPRCLPIQRRGVPNDPARAGHGVGRVHQQHVCRHPESDVPAHAVRHDADGRVWLLRRPEPDRLVYDILFRARDQAVDARGNRP